MDYHHMMEVSSIRPLSYFRYSHSYPTHPDNLSSPSSSTHSSISSPPTP